MPGIFFLQPAQSTGLTLLFSNGTAGSQAVLLDAEGRAQVTLQAPEALTLSGLATVSIGHLLASGEPDMEAPPLRVNIPVRVAATNEGAPFDAGVAQVIAGLVATVAPTNGDMTAEEEAEMQRAIQEAFAQAKSTGFASGLLKLFPLEGGGGLENQATHANWRLRLAEFLDEQTAAIRQAAEEADKIHIEGGDGIQIITDSNNGQMQVLDNGNGLLMKTDFATEVIRAIRETSGNAGWVDQLEKTLHYAQSLQSLKARGEEKFKRFIQSHGSTSIFKKSQELVKRLGQKVISHGDFERAVEYFTPEGTSRLLHSLEEFTKVVQSNETVFAGLLFDDIGNNLLKPKLNEWAQADGSTEAKMVAATVGYQYQGLVTFGTLAATLDEAQNPQAAANMIKRMGGHLTGLAISAALGSQQAKDELWRMWPFLSWESLKDDVKDKWNQNDFFGSGQLAADLALQAVGDLTIFFPVAKGVVAGVKISAQVSRKLLQKLVRSGPRTFARTEIRKVTEKLALTGRYAFYDIIDPAKAKAFYNELRNYYKAYSKGKIEFVDEIPSKTGGQFFTQSGNIWIHKSYLTNAALRKTLPGLIIEELIHFKQIHQAGLLGRTEAQIGKAAIKSFEDDIPRLMRQNGIEPSLD